MQNPALVDTEFLIPDDAQQRNQGRNTGNSFLLSFTYLVEKRVWQMGQCRIKKKKKTQV